MHDTEHADSLGRSNVRNVQRHCFYSTQVVGGLPTLGPVSPALIVAILGLTLAAASLTWQATTFVLTGSRVQCELHVGAIGQRQVFVHQPVGRNEVIGAPREEWQRQGLTEGRLFVIARNVGRIAVTITGYSATCGSARYGTMRPLLGEPALPHRLEPGAEVMWTLPTEEVREFAAAGRGDMNVRMSVDLGNGKRVDSRAVPLSPTA